MNCAHCAEDFRAFNCWKLAKLERARIFGFDGKCGENKSTGRMKPHFQPFISSWIVAAVYFASDIRSTLYTCKDDAMNRNTSDCRVQFDRHKVASATASQATTGGRDCLLPCPDNAVRFREPEPGQTAPERRPVWRLLATRFANLMIAACRGPLM